MRTLLLTLATPFLATAVAASGSTIRPPSGHPLVGKWQWTRSAKNCTETYEFKDDGTAPVVSGTEKTDNVYTVSADPDPNGFYRMTIRTTKDHGGKDCANDESDSTGMESTNYIAFSPDRAQYLACYQAKFEKCYGPLRRVPR